MENTTDSAAPAPETAPQITLQRIYVKDASFEAPNTPKIFRGDWKPNVTLNMTARHADVGDGVTEVVLELAVEAKQDDKVAYLVELQQAGLFVFKNLSPEERKQVLATFCPTQLYPYAREGVTNLITRGGFPQLHLQPVSFEAMMAQAEAERDEKAGARDD